jgi:hypothetical protein
MFRRAFGVAIALIVALVLLFGLQGALINYHGRASMLGIPVGDAVDIVTRVASEIGRFIGWDDLKSIYWYSEGPAHRDPMTHSARPYWLGVIFAWVAVWVAIVALVWLVKSIVGLLFGSGGVSHEAGLFSHLRGPAGHPDEPWLWSYVRAGIPLPPVGGYPVAAPAAPAPPAAPSVVNVRYWHDHLVPLALIGVLVIASFYTLYWGAPRFLKLRGEQSISALAIQQVTDSCEDFLHDGTEYALNYAAACTGARAAIQQRPYAVEALFMIDVKLAEACGMYGLQGNEEQQRLAVEMWAQGVDGCPSTIASAAQSKGLHRVEYHSAGGLSVMGWLKRAIFCLFAGAILAAMIVVFVRWLREKELRPLFNGPEMASFLVGTIALMLVIWPIVY